MAAALTVPSTLGRGSSLTVTGTGWALTHAFTVRITSIEESADVTFNGTTDGSGNLSLPGVFAPQVPGTYTVSANDGTSTVNATCTVSTS